MLQLFREMASTFRGLPKKSTIVLIYATIAMTLYLYAGKDVAMAKRLNHWWFQSPDPGVIEWLRYAYQFAVAHLLFVWIPIFLILFVFGESLRDYGFGLGDWRAGLKILGISLPIAVVALYFGASDPALIKTYPLAKMATRSAQLFWGWTLTYFTFYIAWEAMFRGFLQFGLKEDFGAFGAIMFQVMASTLLHFDKPFAETSSAIFAGMFWGAMALRTRSFWYVMVFHWVFGFCNDLFCTMARTNSFFHLP
ncbi:MAG: type II CAAX endopeptidase family protein [Myxococcota bacterium]